MLYDSIYRRSTEETRRRAEALFRSHQEWIYRDTDQLFGSLLILQWLAGIVTAVQLSPRAWAGLGSQVHPYLWAAILLGGEVISLPVVLTRLRPGTAAARHAVAVGQAAMGALLIHLSGGRIEAHFHIFVSLALLAFYRDWRVLVTFSSLVALDHFLRGLYWPQSVFGVLAVGRWRWLEHTSWVALECIFLTRCCVLGTREMRAIAMQQAELEVTREGIERTVAERTVELEATNRSLEAEVAERTRAEVALRESEARFRSLCACSPIGIFTADERGALTYVNPRAEGIGGYSAIDALGDGWGQFVHPEDLDRVVAAWRGACEAGSEYENTFRFLRRDGGITWVQARSSPMLDDEGRLIGHVGTVEDITERKLTEERLAHEASHDALTGLPNRACFLERLERAVEESDEHCGRFALLLFDLDRFKEINDTFGHASGDRVLRELRSRLVEALPPPAFVARLGGDEFAALLPGADPPRALRDAERIHEKLRRPLIVDGHELDLGASIGIVFYPEQALDAVRLLCAADVAMYAAKRDHCGSMFYSTDMADHDPRRLTLVAELRQAIDDSQFVLYYQPKIDLDTMRLSGAEALVRWMHPYDGLLSPDQFIPLAELTGLIKPLGLRVLDSALTQARLWLREGLAINLAINLAPKNLRDPGLIETIERHLGGPDPLINALTVEITESAIMSHPAEAREVLCRIRELGARISIDDFGTGYSSLAYLQTLPVDEIKIDKCFVREVARGTKGAYIVRSVIDLGHSLGLKVVAEGVEDHTTLDLLSDWGCDLAQGFLVSRPLAAAQFRDWIANPLWAGGRPTAPAWPVVVPPLPRVASRY
jgi:diguanylate cyclase (GGDEF)-like protein/PAS domain S-box-containing protein